MKRLIILGSVVLAGMVSANCANSREGASSASIMAPSAIDSSALVGTMAKGGGGKPGGGGTTGGSATFTMSIPTDLNHDGAPNWGDTVTFAVATTATTEPHVDLKCSQGGVVVYGATTGFYASYPWPWTQFMTLSSTAWAGGSASCTATLYYFSGSGTTTLSTINFTAGA